MGPWLSCRSDDQCLTRAGGRGARAIHRGTRGKLQGCGWSTQKRWESDTEGLGRWKQCFMRRGPRIWEDFNFYVGPYREIPQGLLGSSVRAGGAVVGLRDPCAGACAQSNSCVLGAASGKMRRVWSDLSLCVVVTGWVGLQEPSCPRGHPGPGLQAACHSAGVAPPCVVRTSS